MSWICKEQYCNKQSLYAFKNNKPEYCGLHKKDNMINTRPLKKPY